MVTFSQIRKFFIGASKCFRKQERAFWYRISFLLIVFFVITSYAVFIQPPHGFKPETIVNIQKGETVWHVAEDLTTKKIITSPRVFALFVRITGGVNGVQAGVYRFSHPENLFTVAYHLRTGYLGIAPKKVTLLEGMTIRDIGKILAKTFLNITIENFNKSAKGEEGYLFPDTYSFSQNISADEVVSVMRKNFDTRIASITPEITKSKHSLKDIVIMASLIEREGRSLKEKRMIAGILWNRIRVGMPLQVDAVFGFIFNKQTYSPSFSDLKVDSPYNTYTHCGLPPTPIDNPGLNSILAAATPTKTKYFYYITGKNGYMYYAKTFSAHSHNIALYLRR